MSPPAQEPKIGLDSQCLSYLRDAIAGIKEPTDPLAEERKALLRIWFYTPGTFYASETVMAEVARIQAVERRNLHESFVQVLLLDLPIRNPGAVEARAIQLSAYHSKVTDCRVLAEAEDLELSALLTYDSDFKRRLGAVSSTVTVTTPSIYWETLGIPKGSQPLTAPHRTNPLSQQSWWRW